MTVQPFTGERMRRNVHGEPYELRLQPATVYSCFDATGQALYVGCTGRRYVRFGQLGGNDWWTDVASIGVEHFEDRSDGFRRERKLIRELLPLHNIEGIPQAERDRREKVAA